MREVAFKFFRCEVLEAVALGMMKVHMKAERLIQYFATELRLGWHVRCGDAQ